MKVVHITPAFMEPDSLIGGGERYATELAKAMAKFTPTRLVSFGGRTRREQWGQLEVHTYKPIWHVGGVRWNPLSLRFLFSLADADIVHCHQFHVLPTSFSILFSRLRRKTVFVTDHGGGAWDLSYHLHTERWVRAFLHPTEYCARNNTFLSRNNQVVGGGVDTKVFKPSPVRREQQVLFVGRILPVKGVHVLIEAMFPPVPLNVVGPIVDDNYFNQLGQASKGKKVMFDTAGIVTADHYSRAMVTVLPSVSSEILGLVLLESMACETPVICTRVGGMPEIVEDGVTGFVVPPNNPLAIREKIEYFLANPDASTKMGRRGREEVLKRFTWDAVADRCLKAYGFSV